MKTAVVKLIAIIIVALLIMGFVSAGSSRDGMVAAAGDPVKAGAIDDSCDEEETDSPDEPVEEQPGNSDPAIEGVADEGGAGEQEALKPAHGGAIDDSSDEEETMEPDNLEAAVKYVDEEEESDKAEQDSTGAARQNEEPLVSAHILLEPQGADDLAVMGSTVGSDPYFSGDGPWEIETAEDLAAINSTEFLGGIFKQVADICLEVFINGRNWVPIGTSADPFTGNYDGGGFKISGLNIDSAGQNYVGLFSYIDGTGGSDSGVLQNINLEIDSVAGKMYVGGLAGYAKYSSISNCAVSGRDEEDIRVLSGQVDGSDNHVGGLVGYITDSSRVERSYADVTVTGEKNYVGGLVGTASKSEIENSYATGNVTGEAGVGGLLGYGMSGSKIENCYAAGFVNGTSSVGGLIGGFGLGAADSEQYNYWDSTINHHNSSVYGAGVTTTAMLQEATFAVWDFEEIWFINEGLAYPRLQWELPGPAEDDNGSSDNGSNDNDNNDDGGDESGDSGENNNPDDTLLLPLPIPTSIHNGEYNAFDFPPAMSSFNRIILHLNKIEYNLAAVKVNFNPLSLFEAERFFKLALTLFDFYREQLDEREAGIILERIEAFQKQLEAFGIYVADSDTL